MPDDVMVIPEELMLARLRQAEQMREFFLAMWQQNPRLAQGVGERLQSLLRPVDAVPPAPTFGGPAGKKRIISA